MVMAGADEAEEHVCVKVMPNFLHDIVIFMGLWEFSRLVWL